MAKTRYHISADGNPRPCKAEKDQCPISGSLEHFDNPDKAREYYEVLQGGSFRIENYKTHSERLSELPEVPGLKYVARDDSPSHRRDDGVPWSSVTVYRTNSMGKDVEIADLTVYDDGEVRAYDKTSGTLSDLDAIDDLSAAIYDKYDVSPVSSDSFYTPRPKAPMGIVPESHKHNRRVKDIPEVKGLVYEPEPFKDSDRNEDGVSYSTVSVIREGRTGKRSSVAEITLYENGDAIVWDKCGPNEADIKSRDKFKAAIKDKYKISPYSSPVFRF